jgi:hypothetical protein
MTEAAAIPERVKHRPWLRPRLVNARTKAMGMGGTLLVALSALIAAVVGAALIVSTTDDVFSPWPDGHNRNHARSIEGDRDLDLG